MIYQQYTPCFPLSRFVDYFYYTGGDFDGHSRQIIPDGKTDIIINLGSPVLYEATNGAINAVKGSIVQGQRTVPVTYRFGKDVKMLGIRFRPSGFYSLFRLPVPELSGSPVPLQMISGGETAGLEDKLYHAPAVREKFLILEKWLCRRLDYCLEPEPVFREVTRNILDSHGVMPLNRICANTGEYKKVQRVFHEAVGLGPKLYARMVRFEAMHHTLLTKREVDWMDFVAVYNFTDQSHLIREFRFFTGLTPSGFFSRIGSFV